MYGIAPISGIIKKASRIRTQEDLKSRSFLSHKAFIRKPQAKKDMHVRKSGAKVWVSLRINPRRIGKTVSKPAIWSKKPKFAKIFFIMWFRYLFWPMLI